MNNLCECGCGKEVTINRDTKLPNQFLQGHASKTLCGREKISHMNKGKKRTIEQNIENSKRNIGRHHTNETKLLISTLTKGKIVSEETKQKLKIYNTGKKRSKEWCLKISNALKGRKFTNDHKFKLSLSTINYIESNKLNGSFVSPRRGKNEIMIINIIEDNTQLQFLKNDHDLFLKCGKFLDAFNLHYNFGLEILESHHFKPNGELSNYDKERELLISSKLGCIIYYIPEQDFLSNPEKEIERFKNFIFFLDYHHT